MVNDYISGQRHGLEMKKRATPWVRNGKSGQTPWEGNEKRWVMNHG